MASHWKKNEHSQKKFFKALELVLNSTIFSFNDKFYKQTFNIPMGSSLSSIVSDIVMQDLEMKALQRLPISPSFYEICWWYCVSTWCVIHWYTTLVNTFNSFHSRLKFTTEIDGDKLDFLDVSLIKKGNSLILNWYHKPTFSDRYLNYFSSFMPKRTIVGSIDRVLFLSHPIYHQENFELIIKILLNNIHWNSYFLK